MLTPPTRQGSGRSRREPFQVFPPLEPAEYAALKADVLNRGVQVPIVFDERGEVIAGGHRLRAWEELRAEGNDLPDYPRVVLTDLSEREKRAYALLDGLLRRQLGPVAWGAAFARLLELRTVRRKSGSGDERSSTSIARVAAELGVPERTARWRLGLATKLAERPELSAAVDAGHLSAAAALEIVYPAPHRRSDPAERRRPRGPDWMHLASEWMRELPKSDPRTVAREWAEVDALGVQDEPRWDLVEEWRDVAAELRALSRRATEDFAPWTVKLAAVFEEIADAEERRRERSPDGAEPNS